LLSTFSSWVFRQISRTLCSLAELRPSLNWQPPVSRAYLSWNLTTRKSFGKRGSVFFVFVLFTVCSTLSLFACLSFSVCFSLVGTCRIGSVHKSSL
jgi:hypothetical protein